MAQRNLELHGEFLNGLLRLYYHAEAYREPAMGVGPGIFHIETAALEQIFEAFNGVLVTVFRMNTLTLIKT